MEMSIIARSNVTNIAECIVELVSNSLNANATAIAIRIRAKDRKIQVIDNGAGISEKTLEAIAEYNVSNHWNMQEICNSRRQTLINIRRFSDAMIITSRYHNSSKTYMKIFKVYCTPSIVKTQRRPSCGTTVSIYGFHELSFNKWNVPSMYFLIANIAMVNLQVSFSIRDDHQGRVIMTVSKPHNPIGIFKFLYNREVLLNNVWYIKSIKQSDIRFYAYIGLASLKLNATQIIFLNNKPVHCPLILQVISTTFIEALYSLAGVQYQRMPKKETVFILLFITCTEYIFTEEKGKKTLILPRAQSLLQNIRNKILKIVTGIIKPVSNGASRHIQKLMYLVHSTRSKSNGKIFKSAQVPQGLNISQKDCVLHTLCRVTRRKVVKLKIVENTTNTGNLSKINYLNQRKRDSVNDREESKNDETERTVPLNQLMMDKITDVVQLFTPVSQNNTVIVQNNTFALSVWSNWSYPDNNSHKIEHASKINLLNSNSVNLFKHFDFLPKKLHRLLRGGKKLTNTGVLNEMNGNVFSAKLKSGLQIPDTLLHQEMDVRPCKAAPRFREFRLRKELLKHINILGQMNNELIAGLAMQNDEKVLLLMDQHAIHERIRYESLLHKYKSQTRNQLISVKLKDPIVIQLPIESCTLLTFNKMTLRKFGINLSILNDNTVTIREVPECLKKNKYHYDEFKLKANMQNLLNEILQICIDTECDEINNLPPTIHNAIATEACHGAIKFGDPLTLHQCEWLLKLLKKTKIPTRCAHGRPSIVPILELSELKRRHRKVAQV